MEQWKLDILKCKCGKPEFEARMEKVICNNCGIIYLLQNNMLCVEEKELDKGTAFYTKIKGTNLSERARVKFTTTYFETKIYHDYLRRYSPTNKSSLILDVGCGDGRNINWFVGGL